MRYQCPLQTASGAREAQCRDAYHVPDHIPKASEQHTIGGHPGPALKCRRIRREGAHSNLSYLMIISSKLKL
jgi:hypothetical protein